MSPRAAADLSQSVCCDSSTRLPGVGVLHYGIACPARFPADGTPSWKSTSFRITRLDDIEWDIQATSRENTGREHRVKCLALAGQKDKYFKMDVTDLPWPVVAVPSQLQCRARLEDGSGGEWPERRGGRDGGAGPCSHLISPSGFGGCEVQREPHTVKKAG